MGPVSQSSPARGYARSYGPFSRPSRPGSSSGRACKASTRASHRVLLPRRRRGGQYRRVHAHPGRHLVRGQGADRHGHHLEQGRHLGGHRVCSLGVRPLRLLLGRERQDRRHGAVRRAGRDRRQHRCKRAPGGRAHAGAPVELPVPGIGVRRHPAGDRRRALHDVIAGTAVIYSWDARAARLRFLSRG